jgi:peptidoglycan/LPS O-acetylase OafA/YrhL
LASSSSQIRPARSAPIDGLRALAALSVLGFHVWLYGPGTPPSPRTAISDKLLFELNLGLICFFVLSGFLLYQGFARASLSDGPPVDVRRYAVRRAARIAPAYYACLLGCLALFFVIGPRDMIPAAGDLPLFAVFGQNYTPGTVMHFNPVTWTLAVEVTFYLLLPLIGYAAYRLGPRRVGLQVAMLLGLVLATLVWNSLVHANDWRPLGPKALPAYLGHFAFGMLAALWFERSRRNRPAPLGPVATGAILAAGAGCVFVGGLWHETAGATDTYAVIAALPAALGFALVIAAVSAGRGPAVGWLHARPLAEIGLISYGIYLWHLPLLLAARHLGLLPDAFVLRLSVVTALAVGAGFASWRLIELPLIRRFGSAGGARQAARPRPVATASAAPAAAGSR